MRQLWSELWWLTLVRGLVAVVFGLAILLWPELAVRLLMLAFGIYAIVDGVLSAGFALRTRVDDAWVPTLLYGLGSIALGLFALFYTEQAARVLLILVGLWALVSGVSGVVGAWRQRRRIQGEWVVMLVGALVTAFGVLVFLRPEMGATALLLYLGIAAIVIGLIQLFMAWRLRRVTNELGGA